MSSFASKYAWPTIPYSSLPDQMHLLNNRKKEEEREDSAD